MTSGKDTKYQVLDFQEGIHHLIASGTLKHTPEPLVKQSENKNEDKKDWRTAVKYDEGKPRLDLIPPEIILAIGDILTFGADKYDDRNWEKGLAWGRVYAALQRHLNAWWSGDETDPETGKSHLWHAACCITFLVTFEERQIGTDDRHRPTEKVQVPCCGKSVQD